MSSERNKKSRPDTATSFVHLSKQSSSFGGWFNSYAANCAGVGLFVGDAILTATGAYHSSLTESIGGGFFLASSTTMALRGSKDWGFNASLLFGQIGLGLVGAQGLAAGNLATWTGFFGFGIATSLGLGTQYLEKKFGAAKNWFVREVIGNPRRGVGAAYAVFTLPLFFNATSTGQKLAFGIFVVSDTILFFAKSEKRQARTPNPQLAR